MPRTSLPRKPLPNRQEGERPPQMRINPTARMRPANWADKTRDWASQFMSDDPGADMMGMINPLEVAAPLLGVGFMAPALRRAQANKLMERPGKEIIKAIKVGKEPKNLFSSAYEYLKRYPHTVGHVKNITYPKGYIASGVKVRGEDTADSLGLFIKHPGRSWTKSVEKLNRKRETQTPKYGIKFSSTLDYGSTPQEGRSMVRHELAHAGQAISNKDKPADYWGYWMEPREIRARAVAAKETNPFRTPYVERLRDAIAEGITKAPPTENQAFLDAWNKGTLPFPTKQTDKGPISFRDWMNSYYPGFDDQLTGYINQYSR